MKRRVLGKGIEAIITNQPILSKEGHVIDIDVDRIYPNPFQPRKKFKQEKIEELAKSIAESGMIQPIVVFKENEKYYLFVGERRWRAAQFLNLSKISAIVRDLPKEELLAGALVENIQREDLNAIEIAEGIEMLRERHNLNQEGVAEKLGMNRTTVTNYLRLLKLPDAVKQGIINGDISQGHARALLAMTNDEDILFNYALVLKQKLSVRQTEALVKTVHDSAPRTKTEMDPDVLKMEKKLIKILSAKVKLKYSPKGKGKIEIFFNELEEFERIYNILAKE